ncbi:hypothetical protein SEA_JAMZY_36 [Gordonia phage Jamzy]|nr:hypothetical protein SEA_JAMZY_36 [Gordonia phage Jamzy]
MIRNSHLACTHAATKVGRAQCRKQRAAAIAAGIKLDTMVDTQLEQAQLDAAADQVAADLETRVMKLTVNQRNQAAARLAGEQVSVTDKAMLHRCTLALADIARTKKTTIAKLPLRDVQGVVY